MADCDHGRTPIARTFSIPAVYAAPVRSEERPGVKAVIDDRLGPRWHAGGPVVIEDGFEDPAQLAGRILAPPCLTCAGPLAIEVAVVLLRSTELGEHPLVHDAVTAFGLRVTHLGKHVAVSTSLGLSAHGVVVCCPTCTSEHLAVLGYGEYQPARYVITFDGVARLRAPPERA